ncbi:SDR family NAD(P)-dependent oxidoreductase [Achromobacter xylosoxidans]
MNYTDKVVAITGAASGIGRATAEAAGGYGATVIALDRDAAALNEVAAAYADRMNIIPIPLDVTAEAQVRQAVLAIGAAGIDHVDLLVNCAGSVSRSQFENTSVFEWQRALDVNLTGAFLCTQLFLPLLEAGQGKAVVQVASLAAKRVSYTGGIGYTAAKAGMLGLTRHAAFELSLKRIRVNAVCPGPVLTQLTRTALSDADIKQVQDLVPLGSWLSPEDVAESILFLGSPAARMITGTTLDIDGGLSLVTGGSAQSYANARSEA